MIKIWIIKNKTMNYQTISVTYEKKVCILSFCRPEKMNILSQIFFDEFEHAIESLFQDKEVRVLVLKGDENVFSAGGDLNEIEEPSDSDIKLLSMRVQAAFASLFSLDIPVIAAISGITFGGGLELALHCDIRFCSDNTVFRLPESDLGLIPGAGGVSLFSRLFSPADAAYFLMSCREIPLETALNNGLVQKIFKQEELLPETIKFAHELSNKSKFALCSIKRILVAGYFKSTEECLNMEVQEFASALNNGGRSGIEQFFKNRKK
jgi:enoyl-CoA hydratase/carnithine racemase